MQDSRARIVLLSFDTFSRYQGICQCIQNIYREMRNMFCDSIAAPLLSQAYNSRQLDPAI